MSGCFDSQTFQNTSFHVYLFANTCEELSRLNQLAPGSETELYLVDGYSLPRGVVIIDDENDYICWS